VYGYSQTSKEHKHTNKERKCKRSNFLLIMFLLENAKEEEAKARRI